MIDNPADARQKFADEVVQADKRISAHIRRTPLEFSPYLSGLADAQVYLKLENYQLSGSFKLRGALNKYLSLSQDEQKKGVVTASTGNHGAAVATVLKRFQSDGVIYLPETASAVKVEYLRLLGAKLLFEGSDCVEAEIAARKKAEHEGKCFISPYNDLQVAAGQGVIGIELAASIEHIDSLLAPVGGGGLVAGVAGYLKWQQPRIRIIGCQPENSAVMAHSVAAGRILDMTSRPTISDGTAGGIEADAITFAICQRVVDEFELVGEPEICSAVSLILEKHFMLIEGAAALSVAAFCRSPERFKGQRVVLLLSGARLSPDTLYDILKDKHP